MTSQVVTFVRALRQAGVRVSLAEALDACAALEHIDCTARDQLRLALQAALVKDPRDRPTFARLFEQHFRWHLRRASAARHTRRHTAVRAPPPPRRRAARPPGSPPPIAGKRARSIHHPATEGGRAAPRPRPPARPARRRPPQGKTRRPMPGGARRWRRCWPSWMRGCPRHAGRPRDRLPSTGRRCGTWSCSGGCPRSRRAR